MKLDRVFIGFTRDGTERLLYKTYKTSYTEVGDVSYLVFTDLKNKQIIDYTDVDINSLKSISIMVKNKKIFRKRKIIKKYEADRNKLIDCYNIFFANMYSGWRTYFASREKLEEKDCIIDWKIEGVISKMKKLENIDDLPIREQFFKPYKSASDYFIEKNKKTYECYSGMRKEYLMPKKLVLELDYKRKKEME